MTGPGVPVVVTCGQGPAHVLLAEAVADVVGVPSGEVVLGHDCARCGSDSHGRPVVLATAHLRHPPYVSLARAGALSVVAVTYVGPVGVDAEAVGAAASRDVDEVVLHPLERGSDADPTRAWVRKEALLKACGLGLAVDPRHVALDERGIRAWDSPFPRPGAARLLDLHVPGFVVAVAVLADPAAALDDLTVTLRSLDG